MSDSTKQPTILVVIGITGDLSHRYLLPAVESLGTSGKLPEHFHIVGVSRKDVKPQEITSSKEYPFVEKHLEMFQMNLEDEADYIKLKSHLAAAEQKIGGKPQILFYLAIPPQASEVVIGLLGEAGFGKTANTKLLLEKPFGTDYQSALALVEHTKEYFDEDQVYRIDHYLAKEMAQNLLIFRGSNSLFKRTWNRDFIEKIEVIVAEKIGIEGRAAFYEQTGALRDVVQSHVLQLVALTLMDLPYGQTWDEVPRRRLAALEALSPPSTDNVIRGQYQEYSDEVKNPESAVETFVSMTVYSSDDNWKDVPIVLTTGKALDNRCTEIRIHFTREDASEANQLKLKIQPHEGIELDLWSKRPGLVRELERVLLNFDFNAKAGKSSDAYKQVLLDAIRSDHSLFASSEEILTAWRLLDPIQRAWEMSNKDLVRYRRGATPESIADSSA